MPHEFTGVPVYGSWTRDGKNNLTLMALFFDEKDASEDVERLKATNVTAEVRPINILQRNKDFRRARRGMKI